MLERSRCPAVPTTLMNRLLNMYRDSGTQKLAVIRSSSMKLSRVGRLTKSRGGKMKISLSGLNAVMTA